MDEGDFSWHPTRMATLTELESWLAEVARGDRAAFSRVYGATAPRVFGVCLRLLGDRAQAQTVLQDVFEEVGRTPLDYRGLGLDPILWMVSLARNQCIVILRRQRAQVQIGRQEADPLLSDLPVGPDANALTRRHAAKLMDGLAKLGPKTSEAIRRAYLEGETLTDLSYRFKIPSDTLHPGLRAALNDLWFDLYQ